MGRSEIDFLLNYSPFKFKEELMVIQSNWYGQITYDQGLVLQKQALTQVKEGGDAVVLAMEHSTVLTLGLRSHQDPLIEHYKSLFTDVVKIRRGGHLVIHNPGQLVIYPVVDLKKENLGVRDYLCWIVRATKSFLLKLGVESFEKEEPGLFTQKGKMAMFGVGVNRGITQHGLCINISNDLSLFQKISVCNVQGEKVDRLMDYGHNLNLEECFSLWLKELKTQKPC